MNIWIPHIPNDSLFAIAGFQERKVILAVGAGSTKIDTLEVLLKHVLDDIIASRLPFSLFRNQQKLWIQII